MVWSTGRRFEYCGRWSNPVPSALAGTRRAGLLFRIVRGCGQEYADAVYRGLLRARRDWPRSRAAESRDELAPSSLDHLVCAGEQRRRHVEAEPPSGFEIEHK